MKKSLKKVDMQKPKVGSYYKIMEGLGLYPNNVIAILSLTSNNTALYKDLEINQVREWNYVMFPEVLGNELSSLEKALCIGY